MENPWISPLLALQKCDLALRDLQMRLALIPKERDALARADADADKAEADAKNACMRAQTALRDAEGEIERLETQIARTLARSSEIRKQDEYQAALNEVEQAKNKKSELETAALEMMDKIETLTAAWNQAKAQTLDRKKANAESRNDLIDIESDVKQKIEKLQAERTDRAALVRPDVIGIYDRLFSRNKGTPVVPINGDSCGNCHMKVPLQQMTDVDKGEVVFCSSCSHILYRAKN